MRRLLVSVLPLVAAAVLFAPAPASAQVGSIAGVVRDASAAVIPGVTVEVTSPALIEKVRSTVTDNDGRYQIVALPVGTYSVTFTLTGFTTTRRENIVVTSGVAANVVATLPVGGLTDQVNVVAEVPTVDIRNAGVTHVLQGAEIAELPTQRDIPSLLNLVPGFQTSSLRGACNGGVGGFCNPTVPLFNAHTASTDTDGQNQGRIMVDGMSINMGRAGTGINENVGLANGLVLNTATAEEVTFTLSGSMGESETGGAAINLIPRTGGNRFSGNYALTYTETKFFDRNTGTRLTWSPTNPNPTPARNSFNYDYDMTGAFGGPIFRDRLWFYVQGRQQDREVYPGGGQQPGFTNLNEGKWGANYVPNRNCNAPRSCDENGWLTYTNRYRNASVRMTLQASQRDKFNIFWDEQDACTNPCYGMISLINSPESYFTLMSRPNRLMQLSWTNPWTNRLLFDAGLSVVLTHQDQTKSREFDNPRSIPRICEAGLTAGLDDVSTRVNTQVATTMGGAGACNIFGTLNSGSLNDAFPGFTPNTLVNDDTYRSRASASYITGSHNVKLGWDGAYFMEKVRNEVNDPRLTYHYLTPNTSAASWNATTRTGNCLLAPAADVYSCGNMTMYHPEDPFNRINFRPVPIGALVNTGVGTTDERVWFGALYLQDQWTINRFTFNGALRYDHAASRYGSSCIGPDIWVPMDASQPTGEWCSEAADGVSYDDITPRWGVAWDVFGTGKTSVKWNMGKYLQAAGFGGLYTNFNDARRSTNSLTRGWNDLNGNRMFECDMTNHLAHTSPQGDFCGGLTQGNTTTPSTAFLQFGRPPNANQLANANAACGLPNSSPAQIAYCEDAGQNLMTGWDKRRNEWQFGLSVQHEIMPRVSGELTYNRRKYSNLTDTDTIGQGCDYYGENADLLPAELCSTAFMNYTDPTGLRDFYTVTAPPDSRLPQGGGYVIRGITDERTVGALPGGGGGVTLIRKDLDYTWAGFDTNIVVRAAGGLRFSGGTSTGRANRNLCSTGIDSPDVVGRVGNEYGQGCIEKEPFLTNVRANASYTIPWVDVLAGAVFQYRPGVERSANWTYSYTDVAWEPESADRRTGTQFNQTTATSPTATVDLLDDRDLYGEGMRLFDLTFRKNLRFASKRLSIGIDIYNVFNSDAALGYQNTYTMFRLPNGQFVEDDPNTQLIEFNDWGRITNITNPRFARFSMTFDF